MGTLKALGPVDELWAETRAHRAVATRGIEKRIFGLKSGYEFDSRRGDVFVFRD